MTTSAMLVIAGAICLFLSGFTLYHTMPRDGKPPSAWTRTETRAIGVAVLVLILLFTGVTLVLKGIF